MENGDIYKGDWVYNQRSGEGRLEHPNGDYFIGQWLDDVQKGYGTFYFKNGNSFEGLYINGLKDGPGRYFYAATKKVYEGEWVDDAPRCGEYREPTKEEELRFRDPNILRENFDLPKLGLLDAQSILDVAKSESRQMNAYKRGLEGLESPGREGTIKNIIIISKENINRAAIAFSLLDDMKNGLIPLNVLGPVFHELESGFSDDNMDAILNQLEIEFNTVLSFPEVVDIATFLLSNPEEY
mmetsp:Transcript_1633/g.1777  ORF Transcript_1633/g.1777 Transcript_1633/m.1777 type:complete len:240 (-) Transcript_1633:147-866(-)